MHQMHGQKLLDNISYLKSICNTPYKFPLEWVYAKGRLAPNNVKLLHLLPLINSLSVFFNTIASNSLQFQDQDRSMAILTGLGSLYENKQFTDVILCVEDQEFPCHKNVLAISSPFFMAMFSHDMTESHQLRIPIKVLL